jgi:hypothetical protein
MSPWFGSVRGEQSFPTGGGTVIVCGDGPDKMREYEQAIADYQDALVCAVNRGANNIDCPVQMWCSLHVSPRVIGSQRFMPKLWVHDDAVVFGWWNVTKYGPSELVDVRLDGDPMIAGTSSLFGVLCCLWSGFDRVLVVGVPMKRGTGYGSDNKHGAWLTWWPLFDGRVSIYGDAARGTLKHAVDKLCD